MIKYLTDQQVVDNFGDPTKFILPDGAMSATWELAMLDSFRPLYPIPLYDADSEIKVTKIRCHRRIVPFARAVFLEIQESLELRRLLKDFDGGYAWRRQRNYKAMSRHGWGLAFDINDEDNQLGDTTPAQDPRIIDVFRRHGFLWGGTFHRPDGMHFEFADLTLLAA